MKTKLIIPTLMLAFVVLLSGCSEEEMQSQIEGLGSDLTSFIKGDVTGELNKNYSTQWFDFSVNSITTTYEYAGYEPYEGYKFVVVSVSETNTFDEELPMSSYDFEIHADGILEEDTYPCEALDDTVMPEEFYLAVGESVEYNVVFMIPDEMIDIKFLYVEIDELGNTGATFTIVHSL